MVGHGDGLLQASYAGQRFADSGWLIIPIIMCNKGNKKEVSTLFEHPDWLCLLKQAI